MVTKKKLCKTGEDEFEERRLLYQCAKALCEVVAHWLQLPGFGIVLEKLILP
jgi:hypothetical protein